MSVVTISPLSASNIGKALMEAGLIERDEGVERWSAAKLLRALLNITVRAYYEDIWGHGYFVEDSWAHYAEKHSLLELMTTAARSVGIDPSSDFYCARCLALAYAFKDDAAQEWEDPLEFIVLALRQAKTTHDATVAGYRASIAAAA